MVKFDLFPSEMNSCKSSKYSFFLRAYRYFCFVGFLSLCIYHMLLFNSIYFAYFTNTGILLTTLFFGLSSLSYINAKADKPSSILFLIIWVFNSCITIAFWGYLYSRLQFNDKVRVTINHSVPMICTLIDYLLNRISFIRIQFVFPMLSLLLYFFGVLLPVTLIHGPIYAGIDFKSIASVIISVGILALGYIVLEIGRFTKLKLFKEGDQEEPLIS